jgi:uncharacterized membrane protein
MQDDLLWWAVGGLALLAVIAGLGDWRRRKRRDFDAVGWVPWQLVQILSLILAAGLATLALHS